MKVSLIVPAYNEAETIPELGERINRVLSEFEKELILVDDGSEDDTSEVARSCGFKVIRHPYNIGNGAAIKSGIREARGDVVVLLDADLQHLPEEIPKLLEEISSYDMVIGARLSYSGARSRRLANRFFNFLASYVTGRKIIDLTSGFRAIRTKVLHKFTYLLPNGFSYPTTLTLAFLKSGRSIKFVPVKVEERKTGKSKIRLFNDGVKFILIITKIATIYSPFRIFLPISFFFFVLGLIYYLYTYITLHRFTNMSLLLFTTAVIIFMLSLVSEQIAHLHMKDSE